MHNLENYRAFMNKCSSCAFCQATCPSFSADISESLMPRARMAIIRACLLDKTMPLTRRAKKIISQCLLCGNCTRTCPASIPVEEMAALAKEMMGGPDFITGMVTKKFMEGRGLTGLLRLSANLGRSMGISPREVPAFAAEQFAPSDAFYPAIGDERARVVYFVGCAANSLYPQTAKDVVDVLTKNGVAVTIPAGITCCGQAAYSSGDLKNAARLASVNAEVLAEAETVITECTSCAHFFRSKAAKVAGDDSPSIENIRALGTKVIEATDYLGALGLSAEPARLEISATYHLPCHRGFSATCDDAPRKILRQVPGIDWREMEHPDACCGAGGLFFAKNRKMSENIKSRKMADISKTGADCVVTACPMCKSFIGGPFRQTKTMHPLSLLAKAYQEETN